MTPLSSIPRRNLSTEKTKPNIEKWQDQNASDSCYNFNVSNVGYSEGMADPQSMVNLLKLLQL